MGTVIDGQNGTVGIRQPERIQQLVGHGTRTLVLGAPAEAATLTYPEMNMTEAAWSRPLRTEDAAQSMTGWNVTVSRLPRHWPRFAWTKPRWKEKPIGA